MNKLPEFHSLLDTEQPDIVIGTESWLSPDILTSEVIPSNLGYNLYREDRKTSKSRSGGVFILVWIQLEITGTQPLHIAAFYRPREDDLPSLEQLRLSLDMVANEKGNIWILGDFNLPKFTWDNSEPVVSHDCQHQTVYDYFLNILDDFNLSQMVSKPTRFQNILDLFLTTNGTLVKRVYNLPGLGDHDIVCAEVSLKPKQAKQKPRLVHLYKKADWDGLRKKMHTYQEEFLRKCTGMSVENMWTDFTQNLDTYLSQFIPKKLIRGKNQLPWITQQIRRKIRKRDNLYKSHKRTGCNKTRQQFLETKRCVKKLIHQSHAVYIENLLGIGQTDGPEKVNTKKLFQYMKSSKKDQQGISPLKENGSLHSGTTDKANILNRQFQSVFSPQSPLSLSQLGQRRVDDLRDTAVIDPIHQPTDTTCSSFPNMPGIQISVPGVEKLLKNLKPGKAAGPDQMQPLVLQELRHEIAPIIQAIFQRSLDTGEVPSDWKSANVTPLYKKGDKSAAENYRPISLTCILCKVMEHIITSNLVKHLDRNHILYDLQHGFRERRSCETQLAMLIEDLARNTNNGLQTDLILLDFSKAFDKVSHNKLLHKLHQYGVRKQTLAWIGAFLKNRSQQVVLEGETSDSIPVTSGVPQGSVLGPILFLVYINDLPERIQSQVRLFADDTAVYLTIDSNKDGQTLQNDLDTLQLWENKWDMHFNPSKCLVLHISRSRTPINTLYNLHGQILQSVASAKYLGVTISNNLTWNTHIHQITNKANKTLGFVRRNIRTTNTKVKEHAYKALVRPQVEYASSIWDPHTKDLSHKIEMVQRRAARWTLNDYSSYSSVTDMLDRLGWRTLEQRRSDARLCLFHKMVTGQVAVPLPQYIEPPNRISRYCHSMTFRQIHTSKDCYKFSFFPLAVVQWNSLPKEVATLQDQDLFRSQVGNLLHAKP
ncbi:MAG: reverse transcriptase family protein [Sedimenticola sp.]